MDDDLQKIRVWASHGSMRQFSAEISGKLAAKGYKTQAQDNTLTVYRVHKQGGFLGIGRHATQEIVMQITRTGDSITISDATPEFVHQLAELLRQH